ncbi:MAG: biotin carboxylase N-terminal domain-containing protein [Gammaproteobacteria bacterium]
MIKRLLIANRGEIACRIIRTARERGIRCAAIFNQADQHALHVIAADEAFYLGEGSLSETYLNIPKIIELAKENHLDAIHPGYGFLSENPAFAKACEDNHIILIGPSSEAIDKMGIKSVAKEWVEKLNIQTIPGYQGTDQSTTHLIQAAKEIGLPILIKASYGGGGKGMRIVTQVDQLENAIEGAKRESALSFGSSHIILEKYFPTAYHIEVQVFGDQHGNVVHLFERNCSIQRRYQKIIEEAPASVISDVTIQNMYAAAVKITESLDYVGAGTIEFLVADDNFYFMEMNTRLQVEHPVTEMITGQDLVAWQLDVAEGKPLPLNQNNIVQQGHAIEARIYSEDPGQGFLPTSGTIHALSSEACDSIRIDTGIQSGDTIGINFDPMLSKIIAKGQTRSEAIQILEQGLRHYHIAGPVTNLNFLKNITSNSEFTREQPSTAYISHQLDKLITLPHPFEHIGALAIAYWLLKQNKFLSFWRLNQRFERTFDIIVNHTALNIKLQHDIHSELWIFNHAKLRLKTSPDGFFLIVNDLLKTYKVFAYSVENHVWLNHEGYHYRIKLADYSVNLSKHKECDSALAAPMPGVIRQIFVTQGVTVKVGEKMLIMEAMKMEHTIAAPRTGIVKQIFYKIGDQVTEGTELLEFESNYE